MSQLTSSIKLTAQPYRSCDSCCAEAFSPYSCGHFAAGHKGQRGASLALLPILSSEHRGTPPNEIHQESAFGANRRHARNGRISCAGTCPERSSVRRVWFPTSRLGFNSIGYIEIASGSSCLLAVNIDGEILGSSVSQNPANGTLQQLDLSSFLYTSQAGYRGRDTFSVQATGRIQSSSGSSIITINATYDSIDP